jgi:predicted GNAT superfamily acetyltransferase
VAGEAAGETLLVAVPRDIESLRAAEPARGREWRGALREVLTTLLADGSHIAGFDKSGWYVVKREDRG